MADPARAQMTPTDLVDIIRTNAHEIYAEGDAITSHVPMAFVVDPSGGLNVILLTEFGNEQSKDHLRMIFEGFARAGAQCLGMVFESWMMTLQAGQQRPSGLIADLPPDDRTEMLVIHAVSPSASEYASYVILRGRDRATLKPFDIGQPGAVSYRSRFFDDLPWQTPAQAAAASN